MTFTEFAAYGHINSVSQCLYLYLFNALYALTGHFHKKLYLFIHGNVQSANEMAPKQCEKSGKEPYTVGKELQFMFKHQNGKNM